MEKKQFAVWANTIVFALGANIQNRIAYYEKKQYKNHEKYFRRLKDTKYVLHDPHLWLAKFQDINQTINIIFSRTFAKSLFY